MGEMKSFIVKYAKREWIVTDYLDQNQALGRFMKALGLTRYHAHLLDGINEASGFCYELRVRDQP